MLRLLGPDIWIAQGPVVSASLGFHYPTQMTIIRLANGGLFICSPISLTDELRSAVDALGPVQHIIAPNSLHHLSVPEWMRAYPEAEAYAAPGVQQKRQDISFAAELTDTPAASWADEIDQAVVPGNTITTEIVFFHTKSGTVIFTDLIQHFAPGWFSGWRGLIAKLDLMEAPEASVPRKFRLAFTGRKSARAAVKRILAWPSKMVVMAHGAPVTDDGQAFLKRAFRWLVR